MFAWQDREGRFFNPNPRVQLVPLMAGEQCVVIDDALAHPQGLVDWAAAQRFGPPNGYPYPGLVCDVGDEIHRRMSEHFMLHVRRHLGVRRVQSLAARMSLITTSPAALAPIQWMCHRDRLAQPGSGTLFAAAVLYLFRDAQQGGTSFFRPRQSAAAVEQMVADSQAMGALEFGLRYGLEPGYMNGSNAYFEQVARIPAAWNRVIYYDGGLFHTADVGASPARAADARHGRLTLNAFITCRQSAS